MSHLQRYCRFQDSFSKFSRVLLLSLFPFLLYTIVITDLFCVYYFFGSLPPIHSCALVLPSLSLCLQFPFAAKPCCSSFLFPALSQPHSLPLSSSLMLGISVTCCASELASGEGEERERREKFVVILFVFVHFHFVLLLTLAYLCFFVCLHFTIQYPHDRNSLFTKPLFTSSLSLAVSLSFLCWSTLCALSSSFFFVCFFLLFTIYYLL